MILEYIKFFVLTAEKRFLGQQNGAIDLTRLYTLCVSVFVSSTSTSLKAVQPLVSGPSNQIAVVFGGREVVRNTLRRQTVLNGGSRACRFFPLSLNTCRLFAFVKL